MGKLVPIGNGVHEWQDYWSYTTKDGRLTAYEGFGGYYITDNDTGDEMCLGDGVDMIFEETGKTLSPGTKRFHRLLAHVLETGEYDYLEAYFDSD